MYADVQVIYDLMVSIVIRGFVIAMIIGFVSWGFWYVIGMFKSISRA